MTDIAVYLDERIAALRASIAKPRRTDFPTVWSDAADRLRLVELRRLQRRLKAGVIECVLGIPVREVREWATKRLLDYDRLPITDWAGSRDKRNGRIAELRDLLAYLDQREREGEHER